MLNADQQVTFHIVRFTGTTRVKRYFKKLFKGQKHTVTPHIMRYGKTGLYFYELSRDDGSRYNPVFGVTVLSIDSEMKIRYERKLSRCFATKKDAEDYINNLSMLHFVNDFSLNEVA